MLVLLTCSFLLVASTAYMYQRWWERLQYERSFLRVVQYLFLFNIALQVWDGVATYYGLMMGVGEGNPLVRTCVEQWGVGWALLSAKGLACGLLVFLRCLSQSSLAVWGLAVTGVSLPGLFFPAVDHHFLSWLSQCQRLANEHS